MNDSKIISFVLNVVMGNIAASMVGGVAGYICGGSPTVAWIVYAAVIARLVSNATNGDLEL